jgi:two-component system response regulator YesN
MFRVFIVDDEPSVLEGLKIMIPWSELDFELCGESYNAQEALKKIENLRPHLIITDIRMPQKNGLELINEVRKLDMVTEFVILSGYSDFAYAREAMRHQVSYYLLKPIDRDEIISVLQKIKDKLDAKFLTVYGFSQTDIEAFRINRNQPTRDTVSETANQASTGVWWKSIRDDFEEELTKALKLMNYQNAKELVDELFTFFEANNVELVNACVMVNSFVYHILRIAFERNIKLNTVLPPERCGEWDFTELKSYMKGILSEAILLMLEDRRKNSRSYLYEVKTHIENNFDKELSVSLLAEMVFLDAGYLGDAFSKQFGRSINEYQHFLRIEKAINLIQTTEMKLNDISAAVGYNNYNNFFSHFERITHKKPAQYEKLTAPEN